MINVNTFAANNYMPAPSVNPQPSPLAHPGNHDESEAAKFSHSDANSAANNQASARSKLLSLSAPMLGERTGLQRMYGLSLSSGLLQQGDINPGKMVIAQCYPKPEEETQPPAETKSTDKTKPAAEESKPNSDTKPAADKPKPSGYSAPLTPRPKPGHSTKPVGDQPKAGGDTKPVGDQPKAGGDTKPVGDQPKAGGDTKPAGDQPKAGGDTKPVIDKPKPSDDPKPTAGPTRPNRDARTDDTIYGFNSNTGRPETTLTSASDKPEFNIWDQRGNDTFDFSGFIQDQIIDLRGGALSSVGGMRENVRIGEKTVIENAVGGRGNDRIIGNSADNVLTGGAGADTLVGGGGWNTFKFNAFSDSTRANADLLLDFKTGQDKIDLSQMALDGKVTLNFVDSYTGAAGDTIIKFNPLSGRYLLAIDLDGDGKTDFLIKSTQMISPEDVIGLNIKDGGYL